MTWHWRRSRRTFLFLNNQILFLVAFLGSGQKANIIMSTKTYAHLNIKQREKIEEGLNAKKSLSSIAREIGVSVSTVLRELIRNRRDDGYSKSVWRANNNCIHRYDCKHKGVCGVLYCKKKCSVCQSHSCKKYCNDYAEHICPRIAGAPYTCNGCGSAGSCTLHRFRYNAALAQRVSDVRAKECREGLDVTPEEMEAAAKLLKPLLANKQGLNHIYSTHADDLPFSIRSCYRHIHNGDISIIQADLPKQTKYKKRKSEEKQRRDNLSAETLEGRRYEDFLALDEEVRANVVEMDCVVGPSGSTDAVLTLHFKALHFQIGIKLAVHDSKHVVDALNWLDEILDGKFSDVFGLILCDRGPEFANVLGMEYRDGEKRCSIYYCDARQSQQKGSAEKNHVEFRKVVCKGTSLENIGSWELAEIFSHINSERRLSIFGKCPLELAISLLPECLIAGLGYHLIEADEVMLMPELLEVIRQLKERNGADNH
jgi:IS30 family transposase